MARFVCLRSSDLSPGMWRREITIRFGHCDPAGIVYTPQYFHLFNTVIEEWYGDALGLSYYDLIGPRRTGLGYAHVSADFAQPAKMGEALEIAIAINAIGRSSVSLGLHAFKCGIECARASFVTVVTSLLDHKALPLPDDLREAMTAYQNACMPGRAEPSLV